MDNIQVLIFHPKQNYGQKLIFNQNHTLLIIRLLLNKKIFIKIDEVI